MQIYLFPFVPRACGRSLLQASCRNVSFFRKDRSSDLVELDATASFNQQKHVKRPSATAKARELLPSVTCSDRRVEPRQAWVESLVSENPDAAYLDPPSDLVDLHPDVFAVFPRLDLVYKNLYWQAHYRLVDWRCITTRADLLYRSRRKPWPQKGTGRARHGNRRTHIWIGGGQCHGPRGPESFFSILPYHVRLTGLLSMLTSKQAQGDLHIVEDLSLSEELERDAKSVYRLANNRALEKLRYMANNKDALGTDDLRLIDRFRDRLSLRDDLLAVDGDEKKGVLAALEREREETEEFFDLIKGGKAAEAAKVAYNAADYLRRLVDSRSWGPSVLFVTEEESFLGKEGESASGLAMALGCASYSQYIDAEVAPEASVQDPPNSSPFAAPRALHPGRGLTLMPVQGLNVWSLVHHDTLVLTRSALDVLETRLLAAQRRVLRQQFKKVEGPPLVDDWLADENVFAHDDVQPEPLRNRHFSPTQRLGDVDLLRHKFQ